MSNSPDTHEQEKARHEEIKEYKPKHLQFWFRHHWVKYSLSLICIGLLWGALSYFLPQYIVIWRVSATVQLVLVIAIVIQYLWWCIKRTGKGTDRNLERRELRIIEDDPIEPAKFEGRFTEPLKPVKLFLVIMVVALLSFTIYVVDLDVPDYLGAASYNMPVKQLTIHPEVNWRKVAELIGGSAYYCAGSICTVGAGEAIPGVNGWGRLASFFMVVFDILLLPILLQYILCNHDLAIAFGSMKALASRPPDP